MPKAKTDVDVFDRSFKKIIGALSPKALIGFINGLFGSNHPLDSEVKRLNTEQIDKNLKKRQPDEILTIEGYTYIIEEQTTNDSNMAIRIFEYGYAQALKDRETKGGLIVLPFPRMIVIYLEAGGSTPDVLTVRMRFPDGTEHDFNVKTLKLLDYSVEELAEQGLTALLPFYIIRLRKAACKAKTDEERGKVEADFKELVLQLKDAIERSTGKGLLTDDDIATLLERLIGLMEYVGQDYQTMEVKKVLDTSLMGYGQVLALKYRREGERKGERKGKREGKREGILEAARNALKEGFTMEQAALISGIPVDKLQKQLAGVNDSLVIDTCHRSPVFHSFMLRFS
jgi:hypothetical protein